LGADASGSAPLSRCCFPIFLTIRKT
jgi:hypothetical protein